MALWTPANLGSALAAWYDAQDAASITQSAGLVSQWSDKSGNARHALQSTSASQPAYSASGFNGLPGLYFDGSRGLYAALASIAAGALIQTFATAAVNSGSSSDGRVVSFASSSGQDYTSSGFIAIQRTNSNVAAYSSGFLDDAAIVYDDPTVMGSVVSATTHEMWVDGSSGGPFSVSNPTSGLTAAKVALGMAGQRASGDSPIDTIVGYFGEVVVVIGTLSVGDRQKLEGYLAWHGDGGTAGFLVGKLPSGHPYKSAAPTVVLGDLTYNNLTTYTNACANETIGEASGGLAGTTYSLTSNPGSYVGINSSTGQTYATGPVPGGSLTVDITHTNPGVANSPYTQTVTFTVNTPTLPRVRRNSAVSGTGAAPPSMPPHASGDFIVGSGYRDGSTTLPTLPAGWASWSAPTGASTNSKRLAYIEATGSSHTVGAWTNATNLDIAVIAPAPGTTIAHGVVSTANGTTNTLNYAALSGMAANGLSAVLLSVGHRSLNQNIETAPTGYGNVLDNLNATAESALHLSTSAKSSFSSTNQTLTGTASGWFTHTAEIVVTSSGLSPANAGHGQAATSPTLSAQSAVSPNNGGHGHAATSPTLGAKSSVTASDAAHAHAAGSPALSALQAVSPGAAAHTHAATSPTLTAAASLAPVSAAHGHTSTSPTLAAKAVVTPADASHAQAATSPTLATLPIVSPNSAAHSHAATSPTLITAGVLSAANAAHVHAATSPSLAAKSTVAPTDAAHANAATQPTLAVKVTVSPNGAAHGHVAGQPSLASRSAVTVSDAAHGHAAGQPSLLAKATVSPANAAHGHSAGQPSLLVSGSLAPASGSHAHQAASPSLAAAFTISPANVAHAHGAGSPLLFARAAVSPASASHGHTVTTPQLVDGDSAIGRVRVFTFTYRR